MHGTWANGAIAPALIVLALFFANVGAGLIRATIS
jgi:hypothetical protein